ncbi:alpha/beta fold hydrolase [Streptomyces sp. NBC_00988]|uniref:alpha/beta fold hydrolase n=1 Tax=Streptomyces sp. NBC_00988 TaxID=2903704 RepID=UPI00386B0054|nr:alpha/beta fold hydrolase [Streptomyces sp. NBC_00988]
MAEPEPTWPDAAFTAGTTEEVFELRSWWLESGTERIHYHDAGEGTPVVLLHGSAVGVSAAANWWLNIPVIADYARVVAPDLLGYGWTEYGRGCELGLTAWVEQVVRVLDGLGIGQAVLVGNSLGGRIALQTALDHPERVAGLVTMGSPGPGHRRTEVVKRHVAPSFSREGIRSVMEDMVVDPAVVSDALVDFRYRLATRPGGPQQWVDAVTARDAAAAVAVTEEALAKVELPALILHGRQDRVVGPENAAALAAGLPQADLAVLNRCGHWAQIERRDFFDELLRAFVTQVGRTAG